MIFVLRSVLWIVIYVGYVGYTSTTRTCTSTSTHTVYMYLDWTGLQIDRSAGSLAAGRLAEPQEQPGDSMTDPLVPYPRVTLFWCRSATGQYTSTHS